MRSSRFRPKFLLDSVAYGSVRCAAGAEVQVSLPQRFFLACSESEWLRNRATRFRFVRRAVTRFMPGEELDAALQAAVELREKSIDSVFTRLGEHVSSPAEAHAATGHYLEALDRMRAASLAGEVSVKLSQLGLDLGIELCASNLSEIIERAHPESMVWIDMESSRQVDATLGIYRSARLRQPNVGVCLQAYLHRTAADLAALLPLDPAIRLVKGAYSEPPAAALQRKQDVDENYFALARTLLSARAQSSGVRVAMATHDRRLIRRIIRHTQASGLDHGLLEFQMLYGIQRAEQARLASEGFKTMVLISYGDYWFPWYMRRLAERPANVLFVIRNLV